MCIQWFAFIMLNLAFLAMTGCAQPGDYEALPANMPAPKENEQGNQIEMITPTMTEKSQTPASNEVERTPAPLQDATFHPSVSRAIADLAQRLGVSAKEISLVSLLQMEFTSQAFYCRNIKERISRDALPEVIEGQVILLAAAGVKYEYHANDNELIFCRQQNKLRP